MLRQEEKNPSPNFLVRISSGGVGGLPSEGVGPGGTSEQRGVPSRTERREFWKGSGSFECLELQGLGDPSRTLKGNSRKSSESVSGVFPEFFWNSLQKVPAVLGVWPILVDPKTL